MECCALREKILAQHSCTLPPTDFAATFIPTQPATLAPPATQHFVQGTFLIGFAMRKVLSIVPWPCRYAQRICGLVGQVESGGKPVQIIEVVLTHHVLPIVLITTHTAC